ncbi:AraC family transcriptional regulator [Oryzifoliimicrobium ureilyticus]|uniref:AraC family transcriptional regulator n=1 Tax=Oryzifoliimicrobium ureilyticus TaxID=3113724 RepID=UPI0030761574
MTVSFSPFQEIASTLLRHAPHDGEHKTPIENLILSRRGSSTEPCCTSYRPCFGFMAQGKKAISFGSEDLHFPTGHYLLNSLDLPVTWRVAEASAETPYLCFSLFIDPAVVSDLLTRIGAPPSASSIEGQRGLVIKPAVPDILDAALRLVRLLDRPQDIPVLAPLIEQELLYRILSGPDGTRLLAIAMADSQSNKIARAVAWLRENHTRPLRVEMLAEHVGMSVSSFHHHFKAVTAMTPVQYQKQLRLHEARRLMITEGLDAGNAGHRVGYQSQSQFSRDYSRLHGLPPARDIDAWRSAQAAV